MDAFSEFLRPRLRKKSAEEEEERRRRRRKGEDREEEEKDSDQELIVWPWMAVITNISVKPTGECERQLAEWAAQGYNPVKIHPLDFHTDYRHYAALVFERGLGGLANAMNFEKAFIMNGCGRSDWYKNYRSGICNKVHAWIAREEDYNSNGTIGKHLREHGELKTVAHIEEDDKWKPQQYLKKKLKSKTKKCEKMEEKNSRLKISIEDATMENEEIREDLKEVLKMIEEKKKKDIGEGLVDQKQRAVEMEAREKKLKELEIMIVKRELINKKTKIEMAVLEQMKANESMLKLVEDQKREKEELDQRIVELEKKLDYKQRLELKQLRKEVLIRKKALAKLKKHTSETGDTVAKKSMDAITENLKDKEEDLEALIEMNDTLNIKRGKLEDELLDARKELINGLEGQSARSNIGVKDMEELDRSAFLVAAKRLFPADIAGERATEMHSLCEGYLGDPKWCPFKIVPVKGSNDHKQIIDEEAEKLKNLRREWGKEVYAAVNTALMARTEYNPSGKGKGKGNAKELWNHKEDRKATLLEGISHIVTTWDRLKRKRKFNW